MSTHTTAPLLLAFNEFLQCHPALPEDEMLCGRFAAWLIKTNKVLAEECIAYHVSTLVGTKKGSYSTTGVVVGTV